MTASAEVSVTQQANAIRALAMDAVEAAKSGHPGMPMGMAEIAVAPWQRHPRHNPAHPQWPDRDRFVLSNGHGSMLLTHCFTSPATICRRTRSGASDAHGAALGEKEVAATRAALGWRHATVVIRRAEPADAAAIAKVPVDSWNGTGLLTWVIAGNGGARKFHEGLPRHSFRSPGFASLNTWLEGCPL
jgi:transketolase